jgi:hypothetical protein
MVSQDHYRARLKLANQITREGFFVDPPCDRCARMGERRAVECKRIVSNRKCSNCVRAGRKCEQEFYPEEQWERLDEAREKVNLELAVADEELSSLQKEALGIQNESSMVQEELLRIQKELSRRQEKVQENMSRLQKNISKTIMKHSRLRRQKKYLDERNMKMLNHDLEILEDLDEQNPPPSPPSEEMDFPSSEDLSSSQLLDQMSPDFWAQLGITAVADDNSEVVAGNLSSCQ